MEYFKYMHLCFNLTLARQLARKYPTKDITPEVKWLYPFADPEEIPREPAIFATLVFEEKPKCILIDGTGAVHRANKEKVKVKAVTLDFGDSIKILTADDRIITQMEEQAKKIGLL